MSREEKALRKSAGKDNAADRLKWLLLYTFFFACAALCALECFRFFGRSLIIKGGGVRQHAPALIYIGKWLRNGLLGRGWNMVDLSLGQGFDVLTTLTREGFTDPVSWLSAAFRPRDINSAYALILLARLYVSGFFASLLARECGLDDWQASISGLLYAFSGYACVAAFRDPNCAAAMYLLSFALYGLERALRRGKWGVFTFSAALNLMVNISFAMMNGIIVLIYMLVRLAFMRVGGTPLKECALKAAKMAACAAAGALLASVVLLPAVYAAIHSYRADGGGYAGPMWHYSFKQTAKLILMQFQAPRLHGQNTVTGAVPLALFGVSGLYFAAARRVMRSRRQSRALTDAIGKYDPRAVIALMLPLLLLLMLIPAFGRLMNGMGSVSNGWSYAPQLFIALAAPVGLSCLGNIKSERQAGALIIACMAYELALCAYLRTNSSYHVLLLFTGTLAALLIARVVPEKGKRLTRRALLSAAALVSVCGFIFTSVQGTRWNFRRVDADSYAFSPMTYCQKYENGTGFYRVEASSSLDGLNAGASGGAALADSFNGVAYDLDLAPEIVSDFYDGIYMNTSGTAARLRGLDGDSQLELLASVKYNLRRDWDESALMPFHEKMASRHDDEFYFVKNNMALPIGYTYSKVLDISEYDALPAIKKRDALLHAAVISGAAAEASGLDKWDKSTPLVKLDAVMSGGATDSGAISLNKLESIACELPEEGEVWIVIDSPRAAKMGGRALASYYISSVNRDQSFVVRDPKDELYHEQQGLIIPMGLLPKGLREFAVSSMDGRRDYAVCSDIEVWFRPISEYEQAAETLGAEALENVQIAPNRVSGEIELSDKKWLQFSIPWSEGWSCYVDGIERELAVSGGMYMGLSLDKGRHEVVLRYETPYLRTGAAISASALALCAGYALIKLVKTRRKGANHYR